MQAACGPSWTRVREAEQNLAYNDLLLDLIEREFDLTGADPRSCYQRAKERLEHPERPRQRPDEDDGTHHPEEDNRFDAAGADRSDDEEPDPFPFDPGPPPGEQARVKSLYRELSRRLHPDANGAIGEEELRIWYQVQEAYQEGDLDQLELLLTHAELAEGQISRRTPVGRVIEATHQIRHALKTLRRTIRNARTQPGWGFLTWNESQKDRIRRRCTRELQQQIGFMEARIADLAQEIESWRNPPADLPPTLDDLLFERLYGPPPRTPRGKSDPHRDQMGFDFF